MGSQHDRPMLAVDISSPEDPIVLGSLPVQGWVGGLGVSGSHVYLCHNDDGLVTVDVSDPASMVVVDQDELPCGARFMALDGDLAYVAQTCSWTQSGLTVFDLSETADPRQIGSVYLWGWATDMEFSGRNLAMTLYRRGLGMFGKQCDLIHPGSGVEPLVETRRSLDLMGQNYPNPFNPATRIAFELPRASRISLTIHDARGMVVRRLIDGWLPEGAHDAVWDGRDLDGRPAAAGLYIYRLVTDEKVMSRKMILAK